MVSFPLTPHLVYALGIDKKPKPEIFLKGKLVSSAPKNQIYFDAVVDHDELCRQLVFRF